jgi:Fic family protein
VEEMHEALDDLERFIHEQTPIPPLVKIALVHYQFETIHPFLDGNGRLGRLLIVFLMVEQGLLPSPLLYLSAYFEQRRSDYYDFLQAVRERGEVHRWLDFFLTGVSESATEAVAVSERLVDLREDYRSRLAGDRSRAHELLDRLFANPVLTTRRVATDLDTSLQSASNYIRRLETAGVVAEVARVPGRGKRWVSQPILETLLPGSSAEFGAPT